MTLKSFNVNEKEWQYRSIFDTTSDGLIVSDLETGLVVDANPEACSMHGCTREEFIGRPLTQFIHPDSQNIFNEYVQAFKSGGVFERRALHVRQDGSMFFAEWRGSAFNYLGRPCFLGAVRDVSKRIQSEQLLQQRVDMHTFEQAKLLEISQILASTLDFQPRLILDQLHEIIDYTHGGLFTFDDSALVTLAMRGTPQLEQAGPFQIMVNSPETLMRLFNEHRPIRIGDVWGDDPNAVFLRSLLDDGAARLLEGIISWMWVPLVAGGRIIGGIGVAENQKNYFTVYHAELALRVANQVAIAMINAELFKQAQAFAVVEERQRLARDLHDAINQSLFSAGLIAEVLPRLIKRDQAAALVSLEDLRRLTRGAQAEMRALLAELRPATLTDSNLGDLLHLLGNAFAGRNNIPVTVTFNENFVLPTNVQLAYYRVCQEALFNVGKHAHASKVDIKLKQTGSEVEMEIIDDGQGFEPGKIASGHYGLSMMRERAEAVGAVFSVQSQPGHGTQLSIRWTAKPAKETYE